MKKRKIIEIILIVIIIISILFVALLISGVIKINKNTTNNVNVYNEGSLDDTSKIATLTDAEKTEWNIYLGEKAFALVLAKRNAINSEITVKDKAEFVCFWSEGYDRENYNKNILKDEQDENIFYFDSTYLINIINQNFVAGVTVNDFIGNDFKNGKYIYIEDQNLEYAFIPKVKSATYNTADDTYTVNFVTLKLDNDDNYAADVTNYDESQVESTYNLVVKKSVEGTKIVSITKM